MQQFSLFDTPAPAAKKKAKKPAPAQASLFDAVPAPAAPVEKEEPARREEAAQAAEASSASAESAPASIAPESSSAPAEEPLEAAPGFAVNAQEGESPEARIAFLSAELDRHNRLYHQLDAPEITDEAYDALYRELVELEEAHP